MSDLVNHPPHYKSATGLESIDVIEAFNLNFRLGNVVKYILRADRKGARLQDLKKAAWYLQREIANMEKYSAATTVDPTVQRDDTGGAPMLSTGYATNITQVPLHKTDQEATEGSRRDGD